ncbi:MarR family winged helix-turn-helix transcriptional regulator [Curvivirga aplysinae]|uniref:MarR family winged helix-turn-helix transcriptional regulator n=1 Tax=Curvivirga aplysinae TaxID=2529852 RepID=UPI0012BC59E1|nr:MarR family transcriptional regulator [Curvivirga aplysinae]MTI09268.1 MarR family transcriptional regulator [Curvivirga aplysinae]
MDEVTKIIDQWNEVRPDLDVIPMSLIGRLIRVSNHLSKEMEKTMAEHGLNFASFDLLATLRRSGTPYRLSPNDLLKTMMITSGSMTNRIDQLCKKGLVERIQNPEDARSVFIQLTEKGFNIIDAAVTDHVTTQHRITGSLSEQEFHQLNQLASKFLQSFE